MKHLKSKLKTYIISFLETGKFIQISFAPESENLQIIMTEINRILLEIRLKTNISSPELITKLLAHSSTLNYLFFNLSNLLLKEITLDKELIFGAKTNNISKKEKNKNADISTNNDLLKIWSVFISEFDYYNSSNILFNELKQKIKTENPLNILAFLTKNTSAKFAQNIFNILITLQKNNDTITKPFILS